MFMTFWEKQSIENEQMRCALLPGHSTSFVVSSDSQWSAHEALIMAAKMEDDSFPVGGLGP